MIKLIGKKRGMTSLYDEAGVRVSVTVIEIGSNPVVQLKTPEKDGYAAVQLGWADGMKKKSMTKARQGHIAKSGAEALRILSEFRVEPEALLGYEVGKDLTVEILDAKRPVNVAGTTKGRGFTGGMKRHGFSGLGASHGVEKMHRTNGSLGSSARLTRVWKGKRMSGHMGNVRHTVRNLEIFKVDAEKGILLLKGSVPGHADALVYVTQR